MTVPSFGASVVIVAFVIATLAILRYWRPSKSPTTLDTRPSQPPVLTPSIVPPAPDTPPPAIAAPPLPELTPREARAIVLRDRLKRRLCAHCDRAANSQRPTLEAERSWADRLYVALGATPPTRWRVVVRPDSTAYPESLCAAHAAMARGQLERLIARLLVAQTDLTEKQRREADEYDLYGVDEMIEEHMRALRNRNAPTPSG